MRKILFILPALFAAGLLFIASSSPQEEKKELAINAPDEVKEIIMHSCYGCHSDESTNDKPKDKLNFDQWDTYNDATKVSVLVEMCEVLEEGEMPPEKFLEKYPDRALKEGQGDKLCDWATKYTDELMGE